MITKLQQDYEKFKKEKKIMSVEELTQLSIGIESAKDSIQMVIDEFGPAFCERATGQKMQNFTNFKDRRLSWKTTRVIDIYKKILKALKKIDTES